MDENELSKIIINSAIKIHKSLGPGLLESGYEKALIYELKKQKLKIENQIQIDIQYKDVVFKDAFRADIIVNNKVIIEIKSIKSFEAVHFKQILTYLRLTNKKLGILLNFNLVLMKEGIKRIVNNL